MTKKHPSMGNSKTMIKTKDTFINTIHTFWMNTETEKLTRTTTENSAELSNK